MRENCRKERGARKQSQTGGESTEKKKTEKQRGWEGNKKIQRETGDRGGGNTGAKKTGGRKEPREGGEGEEREERKRK